MFTLYVVVIITVRLLEPGHLEEDYPITTVFENKRFSTFWGGCFLRGQVSLNGFKVFNGCIIGPFAKKLENLLFSKNVVIG